MYCSNCGAEVNENAVVCVKCGCAVGRPKVVIAEVDPDKSQKEWLITLLLCVFVGYLGIHRFYAGKIGTGIVQLLTCGACGIWTLIDLILIILGKFTDEEGKVIK